MRTLEEIQRGGKPFPDRDTKFTHQFLHGLNDEVYMRILPMKPQLLSFRELQEMQRILQKKQESSSHRTSQRKLTHRFRFHQIVEPKRQNIRQRGQRNWPRNYLFAPRIASPFAALLSTPRVWHPQDLQPQCWLSPVTCVGIYIACFCRAMLPEASQTWAHHPPPTSIAR